MAGTLANFSISLRAFAEPAGDLKGYGHFWLLKLKNYH